MGMCACGTLWTSYRVTSPIDLGQAGGVMNFEQLLNSRDGFENDPQLTVCLKPFKRGTHHLKDIVPSTLSLV